MDLLEQWLRRTHDVLVEAGAKYAVVGGLAVTSRSFARMTHDIDFAVAVPDDAEAERILGHFVRRGFWPAQELDRTDRPRLATMRLAPPGATPDMLAKDEVPVVDLIFASCGIEPEVVAGARLFRVFPSIQTPVAMPAHLIAMKVLSHSDRRPKDIIDIQGLIERASDGTLDEARRLVALIVERGFNDNRDLLREFESHVLRFHG